MHASITLALVRVTQNTIPTSSLMFCLHTNNDSSFLKRRSDTKLNPDSVFSCSIYTQSFQNDASFFIIITRSLIVVNFIHSQYLSGNRYYTLRVCDLDLYGSNPKHIHSLCLYMFNLHTNSSFCPENGFLYSASVTLTFVGAIPNTLPTFDF